MTNNQPPHLAQQAEAAMQKEVSGFKNFLISQNVVGIAVGLAVGAAAAALATSFINDIILNPLAFFFGSTQGLAGLSIPMGYKEGILVSFKYGSFLNALVNFLIIALVFYLIVRALGLDKKSASKK